MSKPSLTRPCNSFSITNHLGVDPYERSLEHRHRANGYKPKTVTTSVGKITFDVPHVREGSVYPQALEKGPWSERALRLALAEMYSKAFRPGNPQPSPGDHVPWKTHPHKSAKPRRHHRFIKGLPGEN